MFQEIILVKLRAFVTRLRERPAFINNMIAIMVTEAHGTLHLMVEVVISTSPTTTILVEEELLAATETSVIVSTYLHHTGLHPIIHIVVQDTGGANKEAQK